MTSVDVAELIPGLYFLRFPVGHAYLCADPDGLTLVDTSAPGSAAQLAAAIQRIGREPSDLRQVILTHCHIDHAGSAAEISRQTGAEVLAGHADAAFLRGAVPVPGPDLTDWERPIYDQVTRQFPVHLDRRQRGRELPGDLVVDWPFPVGQVRPRYRRRTAQERRIGLPGQHLSPGLAADLGRRAGVVDVAVRENDLPQVTGVTANLPDGVGQLRSGAGHAGVNKGQPVRVRAQVGMPDREAQKVQARSQFCHIHAGNAKGISCLSAWSSGCYTSRTPSWARIAGGVAQSSASFAFASG